ncbi:MAG TPA: SIMPL domain-containing protein [Nocardioides sp.]|jgi:hypothetical protein|nr:SIMPL domain-containing protein [Nocardioides sp.]
MRTVTVSGHGESLAVPDSAVVRVAAVHRAPGVADALAGADSAARQAVTTAREHTTPERIGSTAVQIWPTHDDQGVPSGFEATHSLTIRCADVDAAGALLTALAGSVAERLRIEGVSLEVADRSGAETAAREAAYADAVARGTHLAELAGSELGDPQDVVEGGVLTGVPRRAKAVAMDHAALEPGEQSVTASVTVTFQLR